MAMKMDFNLSQRLELKMKLAPQIIQSIEILQLPTLELLDRIKQELVENPMLELDETNDDDESSASTDSTDESPQKNEREDGLEEPPADADSPTFEHVEPIETEWREYASNLQTPARRRGSGDEVDKKLEAMKNTAARTVSLQDHLYNQFNLLDLTDRQKSIGRNIIYNIDNDGYLRSPLQDLFPPETSDVTGEEAQEVLAIIQRLEPPGVGARDLQECLLLQMSNGNDHPLARVLITHHLEDIEKNRFPKMVKETGKTIDEIKRAVEFITHLTPRPGSLFSQELPQYITPDVIVEQNEFDEYVVRLEDQRMPKLYVSPMYSQLLSSKNATEEERNYVNQKIQSARWLIDAIEQRRDTLQRVSREIFKIQSDFLDKGVKHLHPLKMRTVAERTGVHVSTVSRAISDKYAQTPRGIFPLKYFFTGGTQAADGEMESRNSVQLRVREVIDAEDKNSPLSDDEIADILQKEGLNIARRTVTKYRKAMKIPSSRQRRAY